MEVSYQHVYAMNKEQARRQLVQTSQQMPPACGRPAVRWSGRGCAASTPRAHRG